MNVNTALVSRVNELYHDAENKAYENIHPEIFHEEFVRWDEFAKNFIAPDSHPIKILDYGSGTGFIGSCLIPYLNNSDTLVCADVSGEMLRICESNLRSKNPECNLQFCKIDIADELTITDQTFDFITLNSVLHHLPDFNIFFQFVDRYLCPEGRLVLGHEPNSNFYSDSLAPRLQSIFTLLFAPSKSLKKIISQLGLADYILRLAANVSTKAEYRKAIYATINQQLIEEHLIKEPMNIATISSIVDFHAPRTCKGDARYGIDILAVAMEHLPDYEVELFETYNYIGPPSNVNALSKSVCRRLKRQRPLQGAQFFVVLKKPSARDSTVHV